MVFPYHCFDSPAICIDIEPVRHNSPYFEQAERERENSKGKVSRSGCYLIGRRGNKTSAAIEHAGHYIASSIHMKGRGFSKICTREVLQQQQRHCLAILIFVLQVTQFFQTTIAHLLLQ